MWINGHRENALNDEENRRKQIKAIRKCSTRRSTRCTGAVKKTVAMSQRRRMEHQPIITITIIIAWDKKKKEEKAISRNQFQYRLPNPTEWDEGGGHKPPKWGPCWFDWSPMRIRAGFFYSQAKRTSYLMPAIRSQVSTLRQNDDGDGMLPARENWYR